MDVVEVLELEFMRIENVNNWRAFVAEFIPVPGLDSLTIKDYQKLLRDWVRERTTPFDPQESTDPRSKALVNAMIRSWVRGDSQPVWQPIRTVPKDETILVLWPDNPQGEVRTAMFPKNYPMKDVPCTHWMPIPVTP